MKAVISLSLALLMTLALALPVFARAQQMPQGAGGWCNCPPPRFQIFTAPKPYGGLLMVDTKTGDSFQRIIVNTPKGIEIRWLKLEVKSLQKGESVLWN